MSSKNGNENENESENNKTSMSSEDDNINEHDNKIKQLNDTLDEIIDKSKSFEEQLKSLKKIENLEEYWYSNDYGDNKLKFKFFKLKVTHMSNEIDKKVI